MPELDEALEEGNVPATGALPENDALSFDFSLEQMKTLADVEHTYYIVRTEKQLAEMTEHLRSGRMLSFDLETDGLDWQTSNIIGFSFSIVAHIRIRSTSFR